MIDQYFIEPLHWTTVARELYTLQPRVYLRSSVIDYWLHLLSQTTEAQNVPYIGYEYLHCELDEDMLQHFRQHYNLPPNGPCLETPVIGFHHINLNPEAGVAARNHYCPFYFDISSQELHVLGFNYTRNESVSNLLSDKTTSCFIPVCERLYRLHGWPQWNEDTPNWITVHQVNWQQNGYDCGPITCQVIEHIWLHGFHQRGPYWNRPALQCGHQMRYRMATEIDQKIRETITSYDVLPTILTDQELNTLCQQDWASCLYMKDDLILYYEQNPTRSFQKIHQEIRKRMAKCSDCLQSSTRVNTASPVSIRARAPASAPAPAAVANRTPSQPAVPHTDEDEPDPAIINQGIHVRDFSQAQISRYPRPTPPPILPPLISKVQLRLCSDDSFDNYQERPSREDMQPIPHLALNWVGADVVYVASKLVENPWVTHRDYGYRLEPDFVQAFHLPPPVMVMDHLMPVGLANDPRNLDELLALFAQSTQFSQDGEEMGAQQMINYAKAKAWNDIFVTGRTEDGRYIRINLERDRVVPARIIVSVDIDSLIWVTRFPKFTKWVNIYMQPVVRKHPPIQKHNHIYINVLYPPSEQEPSAGEERVRFKLNQIPHLFLGKIGGGSGTANLYMVFPRMTHKHPYIRRYSNIVPWDLQGILWDKVIIPAMKKVTTPADEPYIGFDREDLIFKAQDKGQRQGEATYPLKPRQLTQFFNHVNEIVECNRL